MIGKLIVKLLWAGTGEGQGAIGVGVFCIAVSSWSDYPWRTEHGQLLRTLLGTLESQIIWRRTRDTSTHSAYIANTRNARSIVKFGAWRWNTCFPAVRKYHSNLFSLRFILDSFRSDSYFLNREKSNQFLLSIEIIGRSCNNSLPSCSSLPIACVLHQGHAGSSLLLRARQRSQPARPSAGCRNHPRILPHIPHRSPFSAIRSTLTRSLQFSSICFSLSQRPIVLNASGVRPGPRPDRAEAAGHTAADQASWFPYERR